VTITRAEYKLFQRLTKIWFHSSEKSDSFFICGEGGDHDENGFRLFGKYYQGLWD
jgi:hypothetical protein